MAVCYLLDTSTIIDALRRDAHTRKCLASIEPERLYLSSLVLAELLTGIEKSKRPAAAHKASLQVITDGMGTLSFTPADAARYAQLRAVMEAKGHSTGTFDLLIAAQAVNNKLTVVTANLREFQRVPGLKCVNWRKG